MNWNQNTVAPTAIPSVDSENSVRMKLDSGAALGEVGCTDDQLDELLTEYLSRSGQAVDTYIAMMAADGGEN
ncbi:hypothetical protein [Corynebacterium ciconiae]|uniref:hypothetical protein n=1 Tax=Corynebacterium ciconiae TaxID=227319 RepID=UPI0003642A53|nr:hypothetical protein [Corynebacterium ciconiae]